MPPNCQPTYRVLHYLQIGLNATEYNVQYFRVHNNLSILNTGLR